MRTILPLTCLIVSAYADNSCRERSGAVRQDGQYCPEVPPWQHAPVALAAHVAGLRARWGPAARARRRDRPPPVLRNSEVTRYLDTVLAPFVDTYHKNMQNSYQQFASATLKRIQTETQAGVQKKDQVYSELISLADELGVPAMCDSERRRARTLAAAHAAAVHRCGAAARGDVSRCGQYADEMIRITARHMRDVLEDAARVLGNHVNDTSSPSAVVRSLSHAAVQLGYELDLSLTNARRHHEQSCERLAACVGRARAEVNDRARELREDLYYCVYA